MAGIGQSSASQIDQSTPWNSQFSMGKSANIDNHSNISSKYFPTSEKRRMMPEENGVLPQNMYQYNRQPTGFQSSNMLSNDKSFLSNMPSNIPNPMSISNYNMYQRSVGGDSSLYPVGNVDMPSQSKQGFNSNTRLGGMSQFLDSSSSTNQHLSPTPHRTISSGNINPTIFNGQNMSKNRPYNFDPVSLFNQWDTQIGNFDSSEFPSLKTKPNNTLLSQMSGNNYNYNLSNKSMMGGQINYQMVTKSGMPIVPGEHTSEFSIQQEDFPALPVAQNPITCTAVTDSLRSSSASGGAGNTVAVYSCDNSSQSHNSSIVDSNDFITQKPAATYSNNFPESQFLADQVSSMLPTSLSSSALLSSTNNSSQPTHPSKILKKISQGPNNFIANIPNDMVSDAFGLIGLVKLIGINDTYENLNLLAPGVETLLLNKELDSNKNIYQSYVSPLSSNCAGRPHDMDYPVPKEYRIRHLLMDRLADPLPEKLCDETLFWIFYNLTGEECQLTAARQLMNRQWRYNKRERFWLTRDPSGADTVTHLSFERGSYIVWDFEKSKRVSRSLTVYYKDLDNVMATVFNQQQQSSSLLSSSSSSSSNKLTLPFCYNSPFLMKRSSLSVSSTTAALTTIARSSKTTAAMATTSLAAAAQPFLLHPPPPPLHQSSSTSSFISSSLDPLLLSSATAAAPLSSSPPSSSSVTQINNSNFVPYSSSTAITTVTTQ